MSRGRRPEPAGLKEAKGNPGKRPIPKAAPLAPGAITPVAKLGAPALTIWRELAPELERMNFLRPTDRHAFSRYCDTMSRYWDVTNQLRKAGETYDTETVYGKMKRIHPLFAVQERLFRRLTDLEDRFGLSPAARQSIMLRLTQVQPSLPLAIPGQPAAPPEAQPDAAVANNSPIGVLSPTRH